MRPARFLLVCCLAACLGPWAGTGLRAADPQTATEERLDYLDELYTILEETKSPDAFMLTLRCLADEKIDAQYIVPAAIRNAERLGILRDHAGKEGRKVDRAVTFAELLERIHKQTAEAPTAKAAAGTRADRLPSFAATIAELVARIEKRKLEAPAYLVSPPSLWPVKTEKQRDARSPILRYDPEGPPPTCVEAPDDSVVLRQLPALPKNLRHVIETSRDDVQIVKELVIDRLDEPRFFPLVGPARLHHCHWKCTVHYTETVESQFPYPFRVSKPRVAVVYVEQDTLYVVEGAKQKSAVLDCYGP